ncbi:hypothetical protein DSO57_1037975, partial [Entomophthora muscae]
MQYSNLPLLALQAAACCSPARQSFSKSLLQYYLANGCVEWLNGSLVQSLAKLTTRRPEDWYKQLLTALLVCRT